MQTNIIIRRTERAGIPLLEVFNADNSEIKPLVIMYHGNKARKEAVLPQAFLLACEGIYTVLPDAVMHGERNPEGKEFEIVDVVLKTAEEINPLLDAFSGVPEADAANAGIAGFSMGGFIVYRYISAVDRKIKAAVPVISTPDWSSVAHTAEAQEYYSRRGINTESGQMKHITDMIEKVQPLTMYRNMAGTALLMINGGRDEITPPGGSEALYNLLKPIYGKDEALALSIHPNEAHHNTHRMDLEMAAWFKKYLDKDRKN